MNPPEEGMTSSQLTISESAFSCMFNKMAQSKIGHIFMDTERLNAFWGTGDSLKLDTSGLYSHLPIF
jgi:hypothetical protein